MEAAQGPILSDGGGDLVYDRAAPSYVLPRTHRQRTAG